MTTIRVTYIPYFPGNPDMTGKEFPDTTLLQFWKMLITDPKLREMKFAERITDIEVIEDES